MSMSSIGPIGEPQTSDARWNSAILHIYWPTLSYKRAMDGYNPPRVSTYLQSSESRFRKKPLEVSFCSGGCYVII